MNIEKLQDALDYFDGKKRKVPPEGHFPVVLEAARLVANPNIEVFLTSLWAHGADVLDWNKRSAIERAATLAVAAVFTPQGEEPE